MTHSISQNIYCIHSEHVFGAPLCIDQSLLKRIAIVAFHVLTAGIPLAVSHVIRAIFTKSDAHYDCDMNSKAVDSVIKELKPYSTLGKSALEFARKKLEEHPEIQPKKFSAGWNGPSETIQPTNQEIARLTDLYWDVAFKNFEELMKQNQDNPWASQDVIDAADTCMKIAFAISNLTLDDLKASTEISKKSYVNALTEQDAYQYRTFYFCTNIYHGCRAAINWDKNRNALMHIASIPDEHATLFYQKETVQNTWNELYNNYCDRIRMFVNENELKNADQRHVNWTQKDTGVRTFRATPDTQPT